MYWIAHRGNLDGPNIDSENHPEQIKNCLQKGIDVEVDVWWLAGYLWLGHDKPQYKVDIEFLMQDGLWLHCKNVQALRCCKEYSTHFLTSPNFRSQFFFINKDRCTLTSKGNIWIGPGKDVIFDNSICVMPEDKKWGLWYKHDNTWLFENDSLKYFAGICTDQIYHYKELYAANT